MPQPGACVLDAGSGSGYLAAVLRHLVSLGSKVVGIDHIPALLDRSVQNLKNDGIGAAIDKGELVMVAGDGMEGYVSPGRLAFLLILSPD